MHTQTQASTLGVRPLHLPALAAYAQVGVVPHADADVDVDTGVARLLAR